MEQETELTELNQAVVSAACPVSLACPECGGVNDPLLDADEPGPSVETSPDAVRARGGE